MLIEAEKGVQHQHRHRPPRHLTMREPMRCSDDGTLRDASWLLQSGSGPNRRLIRNHILRLDVLILRQPPDERHEAAAAVWLWLWTTLRHSSSTTSATSSSARASDLNEKTVKLVTQDERLKAVADQNKEL